MGNIEIKIRDDHHASRVSGAGIYVNNAVYFSACAGVIAVSAKLAYPIGKAAGFAAGALATQQFRCAKYKAQDVGAISGAVVGGVVCGYLCNRAVTDLLGLYLGNVMGVPVVGLVAGCAAAYGGEKAGHRAGGKAHDWFYKDK